MNTCKISRFNVALPVRSRKSSFTAIYNTLTRAQVLVPADQWDAIRKRSTGSDPDMLSQLTAQGILVAKSVDETALFNHWKARLVHKPGRRCAWLMSCVKKATFQS